MTEYKININSEISELNAVILHKPGVEIERMTPKNAHKALFSDILNKNIAQKEYEQFSEVLSKITQTFEVKDLLSDILSDIDIKKQILDEVYKYENPKIEKNILYKLTETELAKALIEGYQTKKNNYSDDRYSLKPLYNLFFTRDASMSVYDKVLIGNMASNVRFRETIVMENIFKYHEIFKAEIINSYNSNKKISIEGGDVLIARDDILLIGNGGRTTKEGINFIAENFYRTDKKQHIIIQELPLQPESFIHLDMVFTLLDNDKCMVYAPLILQENNYNTIHITIDNGKIETNEEKNLLYVLKQLGMDLEPLYCGGRTDLWVQQREQWHSGANFFAFAPGKVIGYARNINTIEELNNNGFEVIKSQDIISGIKKVSDYKSCVVTIDGAELPRGGGGARCMTMPVSRK